jgi:transcriptional antiterminator NusG
MTKKWYVVHTYSGYEARAKQALEERIKSAGMEEYFEDILIPTEPLETGTEKKKGRQKKFFPGYILIKMDMSNETWHLVKETQKITGFVGSTTHPSSIPQKEVDRLITQIADGTLTTTPKQQFEEGLSIRVTSGPFINFSGVIEEVKPEKQKLRVLVSIFGRATPVELDFNQVERI